MTEVCFVSAEGEKFIRPFDKIVPIVGYVDKLLKLQEELGLIDEDETIHSIPCPTIKSREIECILAFVDHYCDDEAMVPFPKYIWSLELSEYVQPWYKEFMCRYDNVRETYQFALSMYNHAQTLEIQPLMDLAEVQLSILLCNKTVEEHQAMGSFDAKYKPGDPEYEAFRKQTMWTAFTTTQT